MEIYNVAAILFGLTFVLGYINYRYIKLPQTIGLMFVAMLFSLLLVGIGYVMQNGMGNFAINLVQSIDFNETLMVGMLGFLLFAGALHVNLGDLLQKKVEVITFAVFSTAISTFVVGSLAYLIVNKLGFDISYTYSLLFGALISPTDPVAVMGILKKLGAPKSLEIKIAGESLFNDGIGVVFFLGIYGIAIHHEPVMASHFFTIFSEEVLGGAVIGLALGGLAYYLLKKIDDFELEIIGTIALVMAIYSLAFYLHISGPIAIVFAGLLIGNQGRQFAMSEKTRDNLDAFWKLIDYILNALLFVLVGMEILILEFSQRYIIIGLVMIAVVLTARFISVSFPVMMLKIFKRKFSTGVIKIMTWGGLRGGISLALALTLPTGVEKSVFLVATYMVVVFSVLVQGLTIGRLIEHETSQKIPTRNFFGKIFGRNYQ